MSSATGISRNDDVAASDVNKEAASRRVSYGREALLSLADVEACENLHCGFDSSIFWEENCDSTVSPRPVLDSDCCKKERQRTPPQNLTNDPESGMPLVLGKDDAMIGTLATIIEGSSCTLLERCVDPYRPPSLRKGTCDSDRGYKDSNKYSILGTWTPSILNRVKDERSKKDSPAGWMIRDWKANQEKQRSCAELKENSVPESISMIQPESRSNDSIVNKCKHGEESLISSTSKRVQHNLSLESSEFKDPLFGKEMDQNKHRSTCASSISPPPCEIGGKATSDEEEEGIEKTNQLEEVKHDSYEEQCKQSCDLGSKLSLPGTYPGESKLLLPLLREDRESKDLEDPVADALSSKLYEIRVTRVLRKDASSPSESDLTEELHSKPSIARAGSALTEDDFLGFVEFSNVDPDHITGTAADEIFPPNCEFTMTLSSSSQTVSDCSRSLSDDLLAESGILPGGKEMKVSAEGDLFYNVDELFLPDEDSLITLDDLVMSMELVEKPDVKSREGQPASRTWVDIVRHPSTTSVSYVDDASEPRMWSHRPSLNEKNVSLCTSNKPGAKTTPASDHSPRSAKNPMSASCHDVRMNREVNGLSPRSYPSDPLYFGFSPTTVPGPFMETYAMPSRIGVPPINRLVPEMIIPRQYPVHQGGLVNAIPPSPMQHDSLHSYWQTYCLDMNGAQDLASRISPSPANWLIYMGAEAERMNPGYPWSSTP